MLRWLLIIAVFCFSLAIVKAQNIDSLFQQTQSETDTVRFMSYLNLVDAFRNKNIDSSNIFLEKASAEIQRSRKNPEKEMPNRFEGYFFNQKAINLQYTDQYDSALHYFKKALNVFQKEILTNKQLHALINIGAVHEMRGDYLHALEVYFDVLDICDTTNQMYEKSKALNNIALIYNNQEKYEDALEYYNKSLKIKKKLGLKQGQALIYNNLGITYYYLGNYDKVLEYFKRSLNIYRELNDIRSQAMPYYNIAEIYFMQKCYKEALYYYKKSYEIEKKLENNAGQAETLSSIGHLYTEMKKFSNAIRVQKEAAKILKNIGAKGKLYYVYLQLSETYKEIGEYEYALKYYELYSVYKDSVYSLRKDKQIAQIKEQYESNKKDQKITLLEQKAKVAQLESQKQKVEIESREQMTILSLIVAVLGLLALAMIYRLYSHKKLSNQLLTVKNQEISKKNQEVSRGFHHYEHMLRSIETFYNKTVRELHQSLGLLNVFSNQLKFQNGAVKEDFPMLVKQVQHTIRYLLYKSENVIAANEIGHTKLNPDFKAVNTKELISYLENQFNNLAHDQGIILDISSDNTCPENFLTDPEKYKLVLSNLLFYGIQNANKNDKIEIKLSYTDESLLKASFVLPSGLFNDDMKDAFYQISLKSREPVFELNTQPSLELKVVKYFTEALQGTVHMETTEGSQEKIITSIPAEVSSRSDFKFASGHFPLLTDWLKKRKVLYMGSQDSLIAEFTGLLRIIDPEVDITHCKDTKEMFAKLDKNGFGIVLLHISDLNAANKEAKQIKSEFFNTIVLRIKDNRKTESMSIEEEPVIDGTLYYPFDIMQLFKEMSLIIINKNAGSGQSLNAYDTGNRKLQDKSYLLEQMNDYIVLLNEAIRSKDWSAIIDAVSSVRKEVGSGASLLKEELDMIERECVTTNNIKRVEEAMVSMERKQKAIKEDQSNYL